MVSKASSFIGFATSIVICGVDVIAGESTSFDAYVASIYMIRLTRDLPKCLLVPFSSYSVSRPSGQTTF